MKIRWIGLLCVLGVVGLFILVLSIDRSVDKTERDEQKNTHIASEQNIEVDDTRAKNSTKLSDLDRIREYLMVSWTTCCKEKEVSPEEHRKGLDYIDKRLSFYSESDDISFLTEDLSYLVNTQLHSPQKTDSSNLPFIFLCIDLSIKNHGKEFSTDKIDEQNNKAIAIFADSIESYLRNAIAGRDGYEDEIASIKEKSTELMKLKMNQLKESEFSFLCDAIWTEETWKKIQDRANGYSESEPFPGYYGNGDPKSYYVDNLRSSARSRLNIELMYMYYLYVKEALILPEIESNYYWGVSNTLGPLFDENKRWPVTVSMTPKRKNED